MHLQLLILGTPGFPLHVICTCPTQLSTESWITESAEVLVEACEM